MRRVLLLALVLLITAGFAVGTVDAADISLPAECPHCKELVTWESLDETVASATTLESGHYYLAFTDATTSWASKNISGNVCIYMNGKTIQATADRAFYVTGTLSLIGDGTVLGRGFDTTKSNGGAIYVSGKLNIHGATVGRTSETGKTAEKGGTILVSGGTLAMTDGVINGGTATYGGAVYVTGTAGRFELSGGTINGGTVTKNGGTVYLDENSTMVMSGGTIAGGTASNAAGTFYSAAGSTLDMSGGTIKNGKCGTGSCTFLRGHTILSKTATISQVHYTSVKPDLLTIKGEYVGSVVLSYTSAHLLKLIGGDILGSSDNADISKARIALHSRLIYVAVEGDKIVVSYAKPVATKMEYCEFCEKIVKWVALTEVDTAASDMETGHYFLGFEGDSCVFGTQSIKSYNRICLDLNGKHMDATDRAFRIYSGILNVMDHSENQDGLITGRGTTDSSPTGGTIRVQPDAEFNLYSGNISYLKATDGRSRVVRGGVVYIAGGVFNMYGGSIYGGNAKYGANVAVYNDGTNYGHFNMYGGEIGDYVPETGATTKGTGVYSVCYVTLSGNPTISNIYFVEDNRVAFKDMLTIKGIFTGTVNFTFAKAMNCTAIGYGEDADISKATINTTNSVNIKLVAYRDKLILKTDYPYMIESDGVVTAYQKLQDAINAHTAGKIVLLQDCAEKITLSGDAYLDLNGWNMTGSISGEGTLYCMDSATDDYSIADGIYGTAPAGDNVVALNEDANFPGYDYMMFRDGNVVSFHRYNLAIRSVSLKSSMAGLYFTCDFAGDEKVKALVDSFGVAMNVTEAPCQENMETTTRYTVFNKTLFNAGATSTGTLLSGILKPENADRVNRSNGNQKVYGRAYIRMGDEILFGKTVSCNLYQVLKAVNEKWGDLTVQQKYDLLNMYKTYIGLMDTWEITAPKSAYDQIEKVEGIDYTDYKAPWTENVVDAAKADGKLHYYFMAGEGLIASSGTYKDKWGDSYLIVFPNGETMLVDTGYRTYAPLLVRNLKQMGITRLDYILITHPHSDHQGGFAYEASALNDNGIIRQFEIGQVYYRGGYDYESTGDTLVYNVCTQLGLPLEVLEAGDQLEIGGVKIDVLWPLAGEGDTLVSSGLEINNKSVVLRLEYGEHTSLLTGDLYREGEDSLMANTAPELLDVDLLKVPHHGYSTSSLPAFLRTTSPEIAVAVGRVPIKDAILDVYEDAQINLMSDWLNGYIHISAGTDGVMTETHTRNNVPNDFTYDSSGDDVVEEED